MTSSPPNPQYPTPDDHASPSGELQAEIVRALRDAISTLGYSADGLDLTLRPIPLEGAWGFGSAVAFQLRRVGATGNPQEIAERVKAAIPALPQIERVEVVNSYVNFYVDKEWYANRVVNQALTMGAEYGCWPSRGERVMVEYANLNTHKAMHVGHLRNVVLGATIFNILKCGGYDVVGATYLGDIGLHVIRTLWAYRKFYEGKEPAEGKGAWLETLYVDATARLEHQNNVVALIEEAAKENSAIAAQLTLSLQAMAENEPADEPYAIHIAQTLITRDGPDWKDVLGTRDHIVLNLWRTLGEMLVAQSSTLDTTGSDAAHVLTIDDGRRTTDDGAEESKQQTEGRDLEQSYLSTQQSRTKDVILSTQLQSDYNKLDANMGWWDDVPGWRDEIREMFAKWEAQKPELVKLWNTTREWSLEMFRRIFGDLGIHFDAWFFESEVEEPGKKVVVELIERGIAEDHRAEGETVIVRIDDKLRADPELGKKYEKELWKVNKDGTREPKEAWRVLVVLRSDGTSLYATKDLELARRKFEEWHVDRSIYVIDTRQSLYFQQVYRVLELWGFPQAEKCVHLGYEMVNTPEGAISSRKGGAPPYEEFEREALLRARQVVDQKESEQPRGLTEAQKSGIAHAVAYGAMKMGMLDKDNNKVITFDWEQALNPDSQSASYVQYSHARATRVLERAKDVILDFEFWILEDGSQSKIQNPKSKIATQYSFSNLTLSETNLLEMIARFPDEVRRASDTFKPVIIATYCFEIADAFNNFYHNCPILKAETEELVRSRLALTAAAKQTIANALGLLGIEAPGMM